MFKKDNILLHAQRADAPESFVQELSAYLDHVYATPTLLAALKERYELLFGENSQDFLPIISVRSLPLPADSEEKYPGFFETVLYLAAAENFNHFVQTELADLPMDISDTYYKNLRRFMEMNYVRDNSYALRSRLAYFLYGYAKPFILLLGRLSYQLHVYNVKEYGFHICEDNCGTRIFVPYGQPIPTAYTEILPDGEKFITIHIPGSDRLTEESVLASIHCALPILRHVYGKHNPRCIVCHSWLLTPQLESMLKPSANILRFQKLFDLVQAEPAPNALYELVFKSPIVPLEQLQPKNDFQKNVLELYKAGGILHNGLGVLKKEIGVL